MRDLGPAEQVGGIITRERERGKKGKKLYEL